MIEVVKHLRQDQFRHAEVHAPDNNPIGIRAVVGAGFTRLDTGIVYRKT